MIGGAPKLTQDSRLFCMNGGVIDTSSGFLGIMGSAALLFCSDFTLGISAIAGAYGLKKSLRGVLA